MTEAGVEIKVRRERVKHAFVLVDRTFRFEKLERLEIAEPGVASVGPRPSC